MNILEGIIKKYEEFSSFLNNVSTDNLKSNYSREELNAFYTQLNDITLRSLPYEISTIIKEKKLEEYPQLLGVHHYPELQEITFMSEEKKIELDNFLVRVRVGNYLYNLWRFVNQDNESKLKEFLLSKNIIEKRYFFTCNHHRSEKLTRGYTESEFIKLKEAIISKDDDVLEDFYDELYCEECEDTAQYKDWNDQYVQIEYILTKERDASLDNI